MPSAAPHFSIVVLARDEASTLPGLLGDLEGFVHSRGEVLVVDSGSTDETIAVALRYGCRIEVVSDRFDSPLTSEQAAEIERRFAKEEEGPLVTAGQRLFHFGNARQHAGQLATYDFVLHIDASDRVLAMDVEALDRWVVSGEVGAFEYDQHYGNVLLRISRFCDRRRYRWEGRVHEVLNPKREAKATPGARIRCDATQLLVRHFKDESKPRSYLAGLALQVMEWPQQPRWWHYLGRELYYHRRYRSAIAVFEAHAAMENAWVAERSQSLCYIGECLEALECVSEAEENYRRAFELDPTRREPLMRLATSCCRRGEFEVTAEYANQLLTIPRTSAYPELEANYTWLPHSLLYWSLFWLGRKDEARAHWEICMAAAPEDSRTREHARLFPPTSVDPGDASPQAVASN